MPTATRRPRLHELFRDDGSFLMYLWLTGDQAITIKKENPHVKFWLFGDAPNPTGTIGGPTHLSPGFCEHCGLTGACCVCGRVDGKVLA